MGSRLCLPFIIGYHRLDNGQIETQDAYISSFMFFIVALSLGMCLNIAEYIPKSHQVPPIVVSNTILFFLFIATIFLAAVCCSNCLRKNRNPNVQEGRLKKMLPIFPVIVFLLGLLASNIFNILPYVTCMSTYRSLESDLLAKEAIVSIVYHILVAIFSCILSYFCFVALATGAVFVRTWVVRYGFIFVLVTLLLLWCKIQLIEAKYLLTTDTENKECQNQETCLCKNTTLFRYLEGSTKYLYPLTVEFYILVVEIIIHALLEMKFEGATNGPEGNGHQHGQVGGNGVQDGQVGGNGQQNVQPEGNGYQDGQHEVNGQQDGQLGRNGHQNIQPEENGHQDGQHDANGQQDGHHGENGHQDGQPQGNGLQNGQCGGNGDGENDNNIDFTLYVCRFGILFVSILLGVIYGVLSQCNAIDLTELNNPLEIAYDGFKLIYFSIQIVMTYLSIMLCKDTFTSVQTRYKGIDILLLIATFGYYLNLSFSLIAGIGMILTLTKSHNTTDVETTTQSQADYYLSSTTTYIHYTTDVQPHNYGDHVGCALFIADTILRILHIYLQTVFILHANSVKVDEDKRESRAYTFFKQVLLYLCPTNLFIWFVMSFISVYHMDFMGKYQQQYFGPVAWGIITHLTYPLILFYHFNCFIHILVIFLDK